MCGIAGIISTNKTEFNKNHFNILGTLNDERGGDSCGIFIDGKVNYGVKDTALFRNFTISAKYPKSASIALLHCRKASPGYPVNLEQAQPVIIKEDGKIKFVLMHNGTISNIMCLAKKYIPDKSTSKLSDSQILAQIIYECGYNVLEEYKGCAVLIMVDYRENTPKVLIFKGNSCYNEINSTSERPLYYMINNGKFYFSSMFSSLHCINGNNTIYHFPSNKLCQIKNNTIISIRNIDRTKLKKESFNNVDYKYNNKSYLYSGSVFYNQDTGIYMLNDKPVNGKKSLYPSGYISYNNYNNFLQSSFYFYNGRLLYNKECYDFLLSIKDLFDEDVLSQFCPEVIDYFSYTPRIINNQFTTVNEKFEYVPCINNEFTTLFNNSIKIFIKNGKITKTYSYPTNAVQEFNKDVKSISLDFTNLQKTIMSLLDSRIANV